MLVYPPPFTHTVRVNWLPANISRLSRLALLSSFISSTFYRSPRTFALRDLPAGRRSRLLWLFENVSTSFPVFYAEILKSRATANSSQTRRRGFSSSSFFDIRRRRAIIEEKVYVGTWYLWLIARETTVIIIYNILDVSRYTRLFNSNGLP